MQSQTMGRYSRFVYPVILDFAREVGLLQLKHQCSGTPVAVQRDSLVWERQIRFTYGVGHHQPRSSWLTYDRNIGTTAPNMNFHGPDRIKENWIKLWY